MESIIKKAVEGGFVYDDVSDEAVVCDPLFWQSLGKACGWDEHFSSGVHLIDIEAWLYQAERFHEINLTEGWEKAINYLTEIIK